MTNYNSSAIQDTYQNYEHPWYIQQQLLESTTSSESQFPPNLLQATVGLRHINNSSIGDLGEQYAVLCLHLRGAEVFTNSVRTGSADLMMHYKNKTYPIDVKVARPIFAKRLRKTYWESTKAYTVKAPVIPLIVVPETGADMSGWYCRWLETKKGPRHVPEELKDFWK